MNGLCLFETDPKTCIARMASDLSVAHMETIGTIETGSHIRLRWNTKFEDHDTKEAMASVLFAFMSLTEERDDKHVICTVAVARLIANLKYLYKQTGHEIKTTQSIGELSEENKQILEKALEEHKKKEGK